MKKVLFMMFFVLLALNMEAQDKVGASAETVVSDIQYKTGKDAYVKERCKLDVYYDKNLKDCPVVAWWWSHWRSQGIASQTQKSGDGGRRRQLSPLAKGENRRMLGRLCCSRGLGFQECGEIWW